MFGNYVEGTAVVKKSYKNVEVFLIKIGLFPNLKGYAYLMSAVKEVSNNPLSIQSLTKTLYPAVANKYNTSAVSVERSIRNAIEIAYNKGKFYTVANTYYNANFAKYEKPTNGEFIAFLASVVMVGYE